MDTVQQIAPDDCVCPDGKCHLGRDEKSASNVFCEKCINLWFDVHLKHRIEKMLKSEETESRCIVMRSLLQFLGLSASPNPCTKKFELRLDRYWFDKKLVALLNPSNQGMVTYEVKADNLGGRSFNAKSLEQYNKKYPDESDLLARFMYGVHVHTAHLNWGVNHSGAGTIWDINDSAINERAVVEICRLLKEHVYMGNREPYWERM
ncbi:MAG: hypothetical protein JW913_02360 [Chitinispirillaceae bacterium]|nr:hypothetical protein [Chitinispirillaceae bacterium]